MRKILAIAPYPYLPFFSGGQKFIARFYAHLAEKTDLTVITVPGTDPQLATNYRIKQLLKPGFSRYVDVSLIKTLSEEISRENYDLVIWEHPYYSWLATRIRKRTHTPFIIHTHNIEYQRFRSTGRWWWPVLKIYEKSAFRKADQLFFITPEDMQFAMREWEIPSGKCIELPFGVEIKTSPAEKNAAREQLERLYAIGKHETIILFNGLLNYKPNLDALIFILDKVNPLLKANNRLAYRIIICGKGLPVQLNELSAYKNDHVIYAGFVEDIDPYFLGADVLLNPVQTGGGIKTKMVEAIAAGTTVIASAAGATGIHRDVCGNKLVVVEDLDAHAMATAVEKYDQLKEPTPSAFYDFYYWGNVIERILPQLSHKPSR